MKQFRGFTLIEILVVISIIGILTSVIYVSFEGAREQARNRALQTELSQVQLALEVYKAQNGRYPEVGDSAATCHRDSTTPHVAFSSRINTTCDDYNYLPADFIDQYVPGIPYAIDSRNPNCEIAYRTSSDGSWYKLAAYRCLEGADTATDGVGEDTDYSVCPSSCSNCIVPMLDGIDAGWRNPSYDDVKNGPEFYESMAVYSFGGECQ